MSASWTRRLAADLFPDSATPFAWTLLRRPVEDALRGAYLDLGAPEPHAAPLWQLGPDGQVRVDGDALTQADRALGGAAWLGGAPPEPPAGLLARLQATGVVRRTQARIAATVAQAAGLHADLAGWLGWVRGQRWSQADLLHVMEELEPRATQVLRAYFVLRAALPARAQALGPAETPGDLRSADAARSILAVAGLPPDDPARMAALAEYGHRGPGEVRPDARRWAEVPDLLARLAATGAVPDRPAFPAHGGPARPEQALIRAADTVWDGVVIAIATAQLWLRAAAAEVLAAGLIVRPEDVVFLELEELKQVATGEWHGGRRAETEAAVAERRAAHRSVHPHGAPVDDLPVAGEPWPADPGCAPFWLITPGATVAGSDPWSPGLIAARGLGVPVRLEDGR